MEGQITNLSYEPRSQGAKAVRCLACMMLIVFGTLALPGCALFKKKDDTKAPATPPSGGSPPAKFPTSNDPLLNGGATSQNKGTAVLAGRVIDNYSKPPANTSIQLVSMDTKESGNPTEV